MPNFTCFLRALFSLLHGSFLRARPTRGALLAFVLFGSLAAFVRPAAAQTAPTITQQPVRLALGAADAVVLQASASGNTLLYQWYRGSSGDTSQPVPAATGPLLVAPPLSATTSFWVRASNSGGFVDSSALTLTPFVPASNLMLFARSASPPVKIATDIAQISSQGGHTLLIKFDGSLWAMGSNDYGQLGDGTNTAQSTPVQIATGVTQIAAGGDHSLFLKSDGSLWAMGLNSFGRLGDGTTTQRNTPVQVATDVVQISAGGDESYFIKNDGSLWSMGYTEYAALGLRTPSQIATGVAQICYGGLYGFFLKSDTSIWSRKHYAIGVDTTPVQIAAGAVQISTSFDGPRFLKPDGSLWLIVISYNEFGEVTKARPVQIQSGVTQISGDTYVKADGSLWNHFSSASGYLTFGFDHGSWFLSPDGSLWNLASLVAQNVVSVFGNGSWYLSPDYTVTFLLGSLGTHDGGGALVQAVAPGTDALAPTVTTPAGFTLVWDTSFLAVGANLAVTAQYQDTIIVTQPTVIASNPYSGSALRVQAAGNLLHYQWYRGESGDTGQPIAGATSPLLILPPTNVAASFWVRVTNTLAAKDSDIVTVAPSFPSPATLFAFGSAYFGQLGVGLRDDLPHPTPLPVTTDVIQISAGQLHALFVKRDSSVWAMGDNTFGELGELGTGSDGHPYRSSPVQILTGFIQVSAKSLSQDDTPAYPYPRSRFLKADGSLWMTAYRHYPAKTSDNVAQIAGTYSLKPDGTIAALTDVVQVSAGYAHALFVRSDGSLWANGDNTYGQLGDGSNVTRPSPVLVATGVTQVAAGFGHSFFIKSDSSLWAMGYNTSGQLGDGSTTNRSTPVQIATDVVEIAAGYSHSLFIKSDGSLWAMGANEHGQLGDGSTTGHLIPLRIAANARQVSAGDRSSLVLIADSFPVGESAQTISFPSLSNHVFGDAPFALTASASSGLPVAFSVISGYASLGADGVTLTLTGAGSVTLRASQPGNANFAAATPVDRTFGVSRAAQTIAFAALDDSFSLSASASSGLPVTFSVLSGPAVLGSDGVTLTHIAAGSVTVRAFQAGNLNFAAATPVDRTFSVGRSAQTIAFSAPGSRTFGSAPFTLSASASSGLPITFSVVSGPASLGSDGGTLTLTGAGSVTVRASQTGNANYTAAASVDRTFSVGRAAQTIIFAALANLSFAPTPFALSASASSGLPITFSVVSGPASLGSDGKTLTLTGTGSVTVRASQTGNANFTSAASVDRTFTVGQATQTISFASLSDHTYGDAPLSLSASASSGLPVAFSVVSGPAFLDYDGRTLSLIGAGSITVRASQPGNANFTAATPVDRTFSVSQAAGALALFSFGAAESGQLGIGIADHSPHSTPLVITGGVTQISAGGLQSLFLGLDGSLWATGDIGGHTDVPVHVTTDVVQISAGYQHSLFVKSDGSLWTMGHNPLGQPSQYNPTQIATDVIQASAGGEYSLFLKSDGSLWGLGDNSYGQLGVTPWQKTYTTPVKIATDVVQISTGFWHSLFLKTDGSLWGMGYNYSAQLGVNSSDVRYYPVQIATGVTQISAGASHSLFIKSDGSLWAMGQNAVGQLGVGGTGVWLTPRLVTSGVTQISAGGRHSLFIKSDGSLWGMGYNGDGQLGDSSTTTRLTPVKISTYAAKVSAGSSHSLVVASAHTVTFDLGTQGTSGGPSVQTVITGSAAIAPSVTSVTGWDLTGWDTDFSSVVSDLIVSAIYKRSQNIAFAALSDRTYGDAPLTLSASTSSGLPVTFSVVSGPASLGSDGITLTLTRTGSVTVRASQPGNADFASATAVDRTFSVSQTPQTITFAALADRTYGDTPFILSATASSGLPVTFSVVSGPASLGSDGRTLTLTGAGSVTVRAAQPGNANFTAATPVDRTFTVQATQTISFAALGDRAFGSAPFTLSASSGSGLPVAFSVLSGPASLGANGITLTLTGAGSVTVRASQPGNANFAAATPVDRTFTVQAAQTISFAALADRTYGDTPFILSATASSGLPITFSVVSGPATLGSDGHTLTITGGGPVTIRAKQPGNGNVAPATPVAQTFLVNQAAQTIDFAALPAHTFGDAPIVLAASASSGLSVTFSVASGPATLGANGHTLTFTGAGSVTVRAAQAGNPHFAPASSVDRTFSVFPSPTATLTLPALTAVTYDGAPHALLATTTPAGLHVVYAYKSGPAPATATPPTLPGSYTVTATLDDSIRTTAKPKPATGKLNLLPAPPSLPATLARTASGAVDLDLAGANPTTGVTYQAKGIPAGLTLSAATGRLSGLLTAKPGAYAFTVWAQVGTLKSETRACTLTVGGFPAAWTGSFESLIRSDPIETSSAELPVGKLQLTTTETGTFTGSLVTPQPKTFAIKGAWRASPDGQTATVSINAGTYLLSLSLNAGAESLAGNLSQNTPGSLALLGHLIEPARLATFTGTGGSLAPWRGSYSATALTLPEFNLDPAVPARPLPSGTGTATLVVAAKGTLSAKGKLADGSPWTASLPADPTGGYRWFCQPQATPGNYFGGVSRFTPVPDFPALFQVSAEASDLLWHKPAAPKDKGFPAGFGPVFATVTTPAPKDPFAGKFTAAFTTNEHVLNGFQIATDLKNSSRSVSLLKTSAETYSLTQTSPLRFTVPLSLDGDSLRPTARPTILDTINLLDLLVLSDGVNQVYAHVAQLPDDRSLALACWTSATTKLTPQLLAGAYSLHGYDETSLRDATGFTPTRHTLTITPADTTGRVRITLTGLGDILASLSGSSATAINLPQTLGTTRLHAFKLVSDGQGHLALFAVFSQLFDPTNVSVALQLGSRN